MFDIRIFIVSIFLINNIIKCYGDNCKAGHPETKYDCSELLTEDEKDLGYYCCFRTEITKTNIYSYSCDFLDEDQYGDIDAYKIEELNGNSNLNDIEIDCHQTFLNVKMKYFFYLFFVSLLLIII